MTHSPLDLNTDFHPDREPPEWDERIERWIVREQLYPESRGWLEKSFATREDAEAFFRGADELTHDGPPACADTAHRHAVLAQKTLEIATDRDYWQARAQNAEGLLRYAAERLEHCRHIEAVGQAVEQIESYLNTLPKEDANAKKAD